MEILALYHPVFGLLKLSLYFPDHTHILLILCTALCKIARQHPELADTDQHERQQVKPADACKHIQHNADHADSEHKLGKLVCPVPSAHKIHKTSFHLNSLVSLIVPSTLQPKKGNVNRPGLKFREISYIYFFFTESGYPKKIHCFYSSSTTTGKLTVARN